MANLSLDDILKLAKCADVITVDTEGVPMFGLSICFDGLTEGYYLPFNHPDTENLTDGQKTEIFNILSFVDALVFHNAIHDLRVLRDYGFDYLGPFYDTMLMAHWINEEQFNFSLDATSKAWGGKPKTKNPLMDHIIETEGWDKVPISLMSVYGANDAFITHQLFRTLLPIFESEFEDDLWVTEQKFIRSVMAPMMELGIKVDTAFCVREFLKGSTIMVDCRESLGFNPDSPIALEKFLVGELKLPVLKKTKTGRVSFDKETMGEYDLLLENFKDDRAQTILRYRGWRKTVSSNYTPYMHLIDSNEILHPGYKLHGTVTSRLSCEKPALQQIPKSSDKEWNGNLKKAFVARPGFDLWSADFSQLQFRMACGYGKQMDLIEIFKDPTRDIFAEMAKKMTWVRDDVKTLVYLILFGGGATRASVAFGVTVKQGGELVNEFHDTYPTIKRIAKDCEKVARVQGFVRFWTGRKRHFHRGSKYYRAFNAVIQGGEAEIMKRAMLDLSEQVCDENCRMVLQIHDEIVFEIKSGMEKDYLSRITKVMEAAPVAFCRFTGIDIPFKVSTSKWGEK